LNTSLKSTALFRKLHKRASRHTVGRVEQTSALIPKIRKSLNLNFFY
jgi:hypothetical protein